MKETIRVPIYEYQAKEAKRSCAHCVHPFEVVQKMSDASLVACPECGAPMLPVRWSPWSGEIEWACAVCDERVVQPVEPES